MQIGIAVRNMGVHATSDLISGIAVAADRAGLDTLWVTDHIAIPPDDAEGSDGLYLDPLNTLSFIAGMTSQIKLGVGVLILPYRPPLPTAKSIATLQSLSRGRLILGCGIGWMDPEFKALGISRHQRGADADRTLAFLNACFNAKDDGDVVNVNGQDFLFRPNPERPPILIGGRPPHAIDRALRFGDGWMPMGRLDSFRDDIADYRERASSEGHAAPMIVTFADLPQDTASAREVLARYAEAGVDQVVASRRYVSETEWLDMIDFLSDLSL
ncbi:MAG: hypothetical protein CMQ05_05450 [Gammaproteobacteria bacterium]|uniref:Luciferase-like domain-containing protein n=1 Tax=OM182 bacterium MED-G24 TaxID=1986255 RepID=A0A2A5WIX4_9GAMM|nr:hypothetical protein [Gammaproteobacteria bacterium]PDH36217.1 MAG: hypothetical protein CNE99_09990 [OM182 bacterium MED-G24]RPG24108.1 MAG: TIGR03619 family F420-dependent LLM class oxidoreductase [Gammaproteobacteria bacterium TMED50]